MQYNLLFYFKIFQWQYNEAMQFVLRVAPKIYLLAQRAYLIFKYMRQKCYIKKSLISQIELFSIAVQYYFTKPKTVCFANNSISYDHYSNHICTTHVIILFYTIISSVYVRIQKIILWVQDSMQQYSSSSIKGNGKSIFFLMLKGIFMVVLHTVLQNSIYPHLNIGLYPQKTPKDFIEKFHRRSWTWTG